MAPRGRPRLTPDEYAARVRDYCSRYAVKDAPNGLPPFPKGKRETAQHRDWLKLYKAHQRLHRSHEGTEADRRALLEAQGGACPICGEKLDLEGVLDRSPQSREPRALLHTACRRLVEAAESLGPKAFEHARQHLWPLAPKARRTKE